MQKLLKFHSSRNGHFRIIRWATGFLFFSHPLHPPRVKLIASDNKVMSCKDSVIILFITWNIKLNIPTNWKSTLFFFGKNWTFLAHNLFNFNFPANISGIIAHNTFIPLNSCNIIWSARGKKKMLSLRNILRTKFEFFFCTKGSNLSGTALQPFYLSQLP